MTEFTKAERRILREIAGEMYESEARHLLEELDAKFKGWREGTVLSADLIQEIHDFHQHRSRELWSAYRNMREASIVGRGVALELIPADRVPEDLLAKLALTIDFYRKCGEEPGMAEEDE